jgi:hypothetical protein
MHRLASRDRPSVEPRGFVRGGFGDEMDFAYFSVTGYFLGLPGWERRPIDQYEVIYLTGFFAFVALASSPNVRLAPAEAATGARASVARSLMRQGTRSEALAPHIKAFQDRLNEYSALWVGVIKGQNSFGAFASRVFENVQAGDRTRQGYVDHLNMFSDFCERRIKALHTAVPVPAPTSA